MPRRPRQEVEAENMLLYRELERMRERLDQLLSEDELNDEQGLGDGNTDEGPDVADQD